MYERIVASGRADGVAFAFEQMTRTPNTLLAHRLILFADEHGRAEAMIHALFEGLFVAGRDVGDRIELAEIAAAAGLYRSEVAAFLAGDRLRSQVLASHRQAERLGVRGVPVFVFDDEHVVSGAQPPEVLVGLLDLAASAYDPAESREPETRSALAPAG